MRQVQDSKPRETANASCALKALGPELALTRVEVLRRRVAGFGLVELLAMIVIIAALAWLMMPRITSNKASATRVKCVNNLKIVGLGVRVFAMDNADLFPAQFLKSNEVELASVDVVRIFGLLTNQTIDPQNLVCPSDNGRSAAGSLTNLAPGNISYFASLTAEETMPTLFLAGDRNLATNGVAVGSGLFGLTTNGAALGWTKEMHKEEGDVAMADGSVQQMSSSRLRQMVRGLEVGTNYLVMP